MKKGRIILSTIALVAAAGSAFAFNIHKNRTPGNIYTQSNCGTPVNCIKSTTTNTCNLVRPFYTLSTSGVC